MNSKNIEAPAPESSAATTPCAMFMKMRLRLAVMLACIAFAVPLHAATASDGGFLLSEPRLGASRFAPQHISIAGGPDGFLISGNSSHHATVSALDADARPLHPGRRTLGIGPASGATEPLRVGDHWLVVVNPSFLAPERLYVERVTPLGEPIGETTVIPWSGIRAGAAAWNGRTLLLGGLRSTGFQVHDLLIRIATPDLSEIAEERLIARDIQAWRAVGLADGFAVIFVDSRGTVSALVIGDDGTAAGPAKIVSSDPAAAPSLRLAGGASGAAAVWAEGESRHRALKVAGITPVEIGPVYLLAEFEGAIAQTRLAPSGDGWLVAWQGVEYDSGVLRGGEIRYQWLEEDGRPLAASSVIQDAPQGGVLSAAASRGTEVLIAWERHIGGVGTPLFGVMVNPTGVSQPHLLLVDYVPTKALTMSSGGDGTAWAAWIESSGTGDAIFVGRFNADRERIAHQQIRSGEGVYGRIAIGAGGGQTLLVWREGAAILGAGINPDATMTGAPFVIDTQPTPAYWQLDHPAIRWTGDRFLVVWAAGGKITGAYATVAGLSSTPFEIAAPPPQGGNSSYGISSLAVASGNDGSVIAAGISEHFFCVGIPCPIDNHVGYAYVDRSGQSGSGTVNLIGSGRDPEVASDGRDFVMTWSDRSRIRTVLISGVDFLHRDARQIFTAYAPGTPAIAWNGSEYVVAWSYGVHPDRRLGAARLDRSGDVVAPIVSRGRSGSGGDLVRVAALPGDALIGWVGAVGMNGWSVVAPVGEYLRNFVPLPPAPPRPAEVSFGTLPGRQLQLRWEPVEGADGYLIEIDAPGEAPRLQVVAGTQRSVVLQLRPGDELIRILTLAAGGSSEPAAIRLGGPRRRAVKPPPAPENRQQQERACCW
jgi:hypothetical protein